MSERVTGIELFKRREFATDQSAHALFELLRLQKLHGDTWLIHMQLTAPSSKNASGEVIQSETLYMSGTTKEMIGFIQDELKKDATVTGCRIKEIGAHRV